MSSELSTRALSKATTKEPQSPIQKVNIYIFIIGKQTKVSSGKGVQAFPKATIKASLESIQNVKIYSFPIRKLTKVSFGRVHLG